MTSTGIFEIDEKIIKAIDELAFASQTLVEDCINAIYCVSNKTFELNGSVEVLSSLLEHLKKDYSSRWSNYNIGEKNKIINVLAGNNPTVKPKYNTEFLHYLKEKYFLK